MYAVAIIADLCSIIPGVNFVSDFIAAVVLGIIGSATDTPLYSSDAIGPTLLTMLVEAIPGISIVPAWTIRVWYAKKMKREREAAEGSV